MGSEDGTLELNGLRRAYGEVVALDDLSFTVPPGQVFGFLGPNGAGKTTTMRAIFGLTDLDAGSVRWDGAPVGAAERRRFGYMPEERGLYPGMRVFDQLEYLARLHGMDQAAAHAAARRWAGRLGVGDRGEDKVESLSLGNQQRVQLAAALVHDPELLVLDEPFSGLDPVGVDAMSEVLDERAAAGATMLFSSHQLDLVEHLCQSVAIIDHGRLVAYGSVEELSTAGQARVSVQVAGDAEGRWATGLGPGAKVQEITGGVVLVGLDDPAAAQGVLDRARSAGPVEQFGFVRRRLSEVFRDAVGAAPPNGTRASTGPAAPADAAQAHGLEVTGGPALGGSS